MSKITAFDKSNLVNIRAAIDAAMENVEKEFGITIKLGNIKFTSESIKASIEAMIADPVLDGVDPKYVQEILKYRESKDLYKEKTIVGGVECVIVGIKPRTTGTTAVIRRSNDNSLRLVETRIARAGLLNKKADKMSFTF